MTESKFCPSCRLELPADDFNYRDAARTRLQSYCRPCSNRAWNSWYADRSNSAKHRRLVSLRRKRRIALHRGIVSEAKSVPCMDCGARYPPHVMDFDHLGEKEGEISRLMYSAGTERLRAEIAKCEVVCANCHRIRTHERSNRS